MGTTINIPTTRTQCIGAYLAQPEGTPKGGIVVMQEIFGVTLHIRDVADRLAAAGYTAIAPAPFDHLERDVELPYDKSGVQQGLALAKELGFERAIEDVRSAMEAIRSAGNIGIVGFCWGGTVALLAAQDPGIPAVSYYGGKNSAYLDRPLKAPAQFHFGEKDASIPSHVIEHHREHYPEAEIYTYAGAGHAFNRDVTDDPHYHAASAKQAWQRTLAFFDEHLQHRA